MKYNFLLEEIYSCISKLHKYEGENVYATYTMAGYKFYLSSRLFKNIN